MRRFSFHSNGPRRWSHQCKTQRTRGCKGGTVGHDELMSETALGRRQRERSGRGINRYGENEGRKAELAQLLACCAWEGRRNMPELKIRRDDERGCPTRGVLWQEERTKRAKDEDKGSSFIAIMTDRDAGGERLAYEHVLVYTNTMLAACCLNKWVELAFLHRSISPKYWSNSVGSDLTEEETRPILLSKLSKVTERWLARLCQATLAL